MKANFRRKNINNQSRKTLLLENKQKQKQPVHQWRKNKSRKQNKNSKKEINFELNSKILQTRSAKASSATFDNNNSDGNELRLAATILDECETEVTKNSKLLGFIPKDSYLIVIKHTKRFLFSCNQNVQSL